VKLQDALPLKVREIEREHDPDIEISLQRRFFRYQVTVISEYSVYETRWMRAIDAWVFLNRLELVYRDSQTYESGLGRLRMHE